MSRAETLNHHLLRPDIITENKVGSCFDLLRQEHRFPNQGQPCGSMGRRRGREAVQMPKAPELGAQDGGRIRVKTRTWFSQERAQKGISCPWTSLWTGGWRLGQKFKGEGTGWRVSQVQRAGSRTGQGSSKDEKSWNGEPKGSLYFLSFSLDGSHLMCLCSIDSGVTERPLSQNFRKRGKSRKRRLQPRLMSSNVPDAHPS